jgi:hypothetical protein
MGVGWAAGVEISTEGLKKVDSRSWREWGRQGMKWVEKKCIAYGAFDAWVYTKDGV